MAFTDDFTSTGEDLQNRTGWALLAGSNGALYVSSFGYVRPPTAGFNIAGIFVCTDQGTANHYTQARFRDFSSNYQDIYLATRCVDNTNFIGVRTYGTGSAGRRLTKVVSNVVTDLVTVQGTDEEFVKIECDGNTVKMFLGGTGAAPSWVQAGTDQTVTDHNTATRQGLRSWQISSGTDPLFDDFEAGALGSGITGSGTLAAQASSVSGTGTSESTGSGTLSAQDSSVSGTGTSESTGSGALTAQDSTVSGSGDVFSGITGSGALTAQDSTVSGAGTSESTGTGALAAQDSTVSGSGVSESTGTGALTAQDSTVTGSGTVGNVITGTGALVAQDSTVSGAGTSESTGSGALVASDSTVSGTGTVPITGSGALSAGASTVSGTGALGAGALVTGGGAAKGHSIYNPWPFTTGEFNNPLALYMQDEFRRLADQLHEFFRGWGDNIVDLEGLSAHGGNSPSFTADASGIDAWQFHQTTLNELWITFHIGHDIAPGSSIYPFIQWAPSDASAGTVRWGLEYSYARSHSQEAFPASTTIYIDDAAGGTASLNQIAEASDNQALALAFEPHGILRMRLFRDGTTNAEDTYGAGAFAYAVGLHYDKMMFATKNKAPDFYK